MSDIEAVVTSDAHGSTGGNGTAPRPLDVNVGKPRSLAGDAWRDLRRSPLFWIAALLVLAFVVMALFPRVYTSINPRGCDLDVSLESPNSQHWFGTDVQGCDVYARTVYGARASILVGVLSTLTAGILALVVGMAAGFYGGWVDAILARVVDIVLGIPLLLAAIVFGRSFAHQKGVWPVVIVLGLLGWTTAARVIRSSVISAKQQDYVQAARMLGANNRRIMVRHILPNALAPTIVVLTIALGVFISTEATLSYLGVGLRPPAISWGGEISSAQGRFQQAPWPLLFPAGFLALTVLAFSMLGEAVREAFDPRLR
jgi:peptide/nickel transport system permease protein/oligopeptide transport system permease protein